MNELSRWLNKRREFKRRRNFYSQFISSGDLCFDVGANYGNRTKIFLTLGARVVAVEPQELCMAKLRRRFGRNRNLTLVPQALGAAVGEKQIYLSAASTVSSMSSDWIEKVKASGRFANVEWNGSAKVSVTTLDALIAKHGTPVFCKLDVEGFEAEILSGLSRPIRTVSFEFTPEIIEVALACITRLEQLVCYEFNVSFAESMQFHLPSWVGASEISRLLTEITPDKKCFGDVYARIFKP
jgi:FkbM family methyltransferase